MIVGFVYGLNFQFFLLDSDLPLSLYKLFCIIVLSILLIGFTHPPHASSEHVERYFQFFLLDSIASVLVAHNYEVYLSILLIGFIESGVDVEMSAENRLIFQFFLLDSLWSPPLERVFKRWLSILLIGFVSFLYNEGVSSGSDFQFFLLDSELDL